MQTLEEAQRENKRLLDLIKSITQQQQKEKHEKHEEEEQRLKEEAEKREEEQRQKDEAEKREKELRRQRLIEEAEKREEEQRQKEEAEKREKELRRQLEEAEKRVEEERRQKEYERRLKEEERRQKEEEIRLKEEERRQKEEERRLKEEERRQKEEEIRLKEEERRQKEEEIRLKEEERRQKEEEIRLKEEERRQKEEIRQEREKLQKQQRPTQLLEYLSLVEDHLFKSLTVERDPNKASAPGTTEVGGRCYPEHFRPWTDFPAAHATVFEHLTETFGEKETFPSRIAMLALSANISPKVSDEMDLRPFLRNAVEKPAESIVTQYLQLQEHPTLKGFKFRNNSYGQVFRELGVGLGVGEAKAGSASGAAGAPKASGMAKGTSKQSKQSKQPSKRLPSPVKQIGNPDRWGFAVHWSDKETNTHVLVGEYKAAHNLHASKLRAVMSQPPRDNFFLQAAREDATDTTEAVSARIGSVYVARVLCQAYHYMISSGLEYGYVASGEGLVLLRVPEDDANTLYYFWRVFAPASDNAVEVARQPQNTAAGYLASLAMMGLQSTKRPETWITKQEAELRRWPRPPRKVLEAPVLSLRPRDGDSGPDRQGGGDGGGDGGSGGGGGGGDTNNQTGSRDQSPRKRRRGPDSDESGHSAPTEHGSTLAASPLLPFCTQACLLGISRRLPLDPGCPNVQLHRAARERLRGSDLPKDGQPEDGHALDEKELRDLVAEQAKTDGAVNMRSLESVGLYGRVGVLVRITVAGYGYTLVAKGIMFMFRGVLEHELSIYEGLSDCQGRLVPVCLGMVKLPESFDPGPCCNRLYQLLLLSFAGPDLTHDEALPCRVDVQEEMNRTGRELRALGLCNDDVRIHNCAWNEEVRRVMYFDFDQAYFESSEPGTPESLESSEPIKTAEPSELGTPQIEPLTDLPELPDPEPAKLAESRQAPADQTRSPSPAKRDWSQFCDGSSPDEYTN